MNRIIRIYPYLAAAILAPLSAWLWWQTYHNYMQVALAWFLPILWAYIVPGVGTNICRVWEVKSRFNFGRFRVQHGFVFGSATALITWMVYGYPINTVTDCFKVALMMASVLGFWNILYEVVAIKAGVLIVYNQPWADRKGAEAIVFDYAPWIFGGFGFAYGLSIAVFEYVLKFNGIPKVSLFFLYFIVALIFCIAVPILGFMHSSWRKHGHCGTRPVSLKK